MVVFAFLFVRLRHPHCVPAEDSFSYVAFRASFLTAVKSIKLEKALLDARGCHAKLTAEQLFLHQQDD